MTPIWFKGIVRLTQRVPEMQNFLIWNCYPADGEGGEENKNGEEIKF